MVSTSECEVGGADGYTDQLLSAEEALQNAGEKFECAQSVFWGCFAELRGPEVLGSGKFSCVG